MGGGKKGIGCSSNVQDMARRDVSHFSVRWLRSDAWPNYFECQKTSSPVQLQKWLCFASCL